MNDNKDWIKDEELKNIPTEKLLFLEQMLFESKKYTGKELFPFFMSLAMRAKKNNVSYTQEELEIIIPVLKKYASYEDIEKMNKVISMFKKNK